MPLRSGKPTTRTSRGSLRYSLGSRRSPGFASSTMRGRNLVRVRSRRISYNMFEAFNRRGCRITEAACWRRDQSPATIECTGVLERARERGCNLPISAAASPRRARSTSRRTGTFAQNRLCSESCPLNASHVPKPVAENPKSSHCSPCGASPLPLTRLHWAARRPLPRLKATPPCAASLGC